MEKADRNDGYGRGDIVGTAEAARQKVIRELETEGVVMTEDDRAELLRMAQSLEEHLREVSEGHEEREV